MTMPTTEALPIISTGLLWGSKNTSALVRWLRAYYWTRSTRKPSLALGYAFSHTTGYNIGPKTAKVTANQWRPREDFDLDTAVNKAQNISA